MGNKSSSNQIAYTTNCVVYRPICSPPGTVFSHWQLVKRSDDEGYDYIPIHKKKSRNETETPSSPCSKTTLHISRTKPKIIVSQFCDVDPKKETERPSMTTVDISRTKSKEMVSQFYDVEPQVEKEILLRPRSKTIHDIPQTKPKDAVAQFFQFDHANSGKDVDLRPRAGSLRGNETFKEMTDCESNPNHKEQNHKEREVPSRPRSKTIHDVPRTKPKIIVSQFFQFDHVNSGKDVDLRPRAGSFRGNEKFKEKTGCESNPIHKEQNHKERKIPSRPRSKTIHDVPRAKPKIIASQFFEFDNVNSGKDVDLRSKAGSLRGNEKFKEMEGCESNPIHKEKNHKEREIPSRPRSKTIHDVPRTKPKGIVTQFFHLDHANSGKEDDLREKPDPSRKHVIYKEIEDREAYPIHKEKSHNEREIQLRPRSKTIQDVPRTKSQDFGSQYYYYLDHTKPLKDADLRAKGLQCKSGTLKNCRKPTLGQQFPSTNKTRLKHTNINTLLSKEPNTQRFPKPPSIPRSQSSKDLQQVSKTSAYFKTGRRILHKCHSFPDVRCTSDLKLPKATTNFTGHGKLVKSCVSKSTEGRNLDSRFKNTNVFNGFKGHSFNAANNNGTKEEQSVTGKRNVSKQQDVKLTIVNCEKPSTVLNESFFDLDNNPISFECSKYSAAKRHAVFTINHEDGRLQALSNLLPVPEEPAHQPHVRSPWQCYSNESCPMGKLLDSTATNQELADSVTQRSPWNYYGDESKSHVIDDLFDSGEERLVVKKREIINNGLDPAKKAMINNWILDVTLNAPRPMND
ncbi:hypothetical protein AC249_AIPGENE9753 [Exaiptasia diaphana]|nr:hypothetical protein AC249_AIPGENE9753 [Exaiptasia diaphana]